MNLKYILIAATIVLMSSCDSTSRFWGKGKARTAVDSFATYYFNWQFYNAKRFVTDSSQVWLRYAASQVHEADLEILREKEDAVVTIEELNMDDDITTARIKVNDFLRMDTIGTEGHIVKEATFVLHLEKSGEEEDWKVRMEGLPQSEKRNRD